MPTATDLEKIRVIKQQNPLINAMMAGNLTGRGAFAQPPRAPAQPGTAYAATTPQPAQTSSYNKGPIPGQYADIRGIEEKTNYPKAVNPNPGGGNFFRDVILPMLPSLIATGVGVASPQALPGAAGFSQGYGSAIEKERDRTEKERERKERVQTYTFNPDTGEYMPTGITIPKDAQIRNLTSENKTEIESLIEGLSGIKTKGTDQIKKEVKAKYNVGQTLKKGGVSWKVVGFDEDGEPLVEAGE